METRQDAGPELRLVHSDDDLPRLATAQKTAAQTLPLWHVRVTLGGSSVDPATLHRALVRMCGDGTFLGSARYRADRVELTYWDEAEDVDDAAALALRVWSDHRRAAGLPAWTVVGLEVLGRDLQRARGRDGLSVSMPVGDVRPLEPT